MINWKIKEVDIKDLKGYDKNPRSITNKSLDLLKESLREYGQVIPLVVNADMTVLGGNQRLKILNGKVQVKYPDRQLTEKESAELVVILNNKMGEWDFTKLELLGFTKDVLIDDFGFDEEYIEKQSFKIDDLDNFLDDNFLDDGFTEKNKDGTIKQLMIKFTDIDKTAIEIQNIIKVQLKKEQVSSMEDLITAKCRIYETNNT